MNINAAQNDASKIIATLATRLNETDCIAVCVSLAGRARKRLEHVRNECQRIIDERLLGRPGKPQFTIHEREAIQERLSTLVSETDAQIEALVTARRERIAEQSGQPKQSITPVLKS